LTFIKTTLNFEKSLKSDNQKTKIIFLVLKIGQNILLAHASDVFAEMTYKPF
jgi:hypothetical protein